VRRPDLPLIGLVLAAGAALAITADPSDPAPPAGEAGAAARPDAVDSMLADPDPSLFGCFQQAQPQPGDAPARLQALVKVVSARVARLRELAFEHPVDAQFLSAGELTDRVRGLVADELKRNQVRAEQSILELLGAVPPETDLYELTKQSLGSQVIGLYDPKSRQLLVQAEGDPGPEEVTTLAHELEHALADQSLDVKERVGGYADADLAYSALVEGDATVTMELYALAYIGLDEQLDDVDENLPGERQFDRMPDYLQRNLLFPYLQGLQFVCNRWDAGGWAAVDRIYREPPASTAEVLFPERYGGPGPEEVHSAGDPGRGWRKLAERMLGAAELEWLLSAPAGDPEASLPDPKRLVSGWAGGTVELWERGDAHALGISLAELPHSSLLCGALDAWQRQGWPDSAAKQRDGGATVFDGDERDVAIVCSRTRTGMGIGPDERTAIALAGPAARPPE